MTIQGIHVAALSVIDDENVEVEAGEINRGGQASRASADDQALEV